MLLHSLSSASVTPFSLNPFPLPPHSSYKPSNVAVRLIQDMLVFARAAHQEHMQSWHHSVCQLQVYHSSLMCIREAAEPLLSMFVNPCVGLFQTHQHPSCLNILSTCVEFFGQKPAAANMLTHALYTSCSASEPVFSVSQLLSMHTRTHAPLMRALRQRAYATWSYMLHIIGG